MLSHLHHQVSCDLKERILLAPKFLHFVLHSPLSISSAVPSLLQWNIIIVRGKYSVHKQPLKLSHPHYKITVVVVILLLKISSFFILLYLLTKMYGRLFFIDDLLLSG